jgi:hypothetical protein
MGKEQLKSRLAKCFKYNRYDDAVAKAPLCIAEEAYYRSNWEGRQQRIANRAIGPESAQDPFTASAKLELDENSDEKVYIWLDLMIDNSGHPSGEIVAY